jgi:hypothetical protein
MLREFDLDSTFLRHPFFAYNKPDPNEQDHYVRSGNVSISRIGYGKNIDIITKANDLIRFDESKIKLYGYMHHDYVQSELGPGDFLGYYNGKFESSFTRVAQILDSRRFVVDMSVQQNDGGGTQYTFLEAIYHDCALILHRKWIEGVDERFRVFKEGYNCLAVDNEIELAEILNNNDLDVSKIVEHSKSLLNEHIQADWSAFIA